MSQFTWLPFFEELLSVICEKYDKHSLCEVFYELFGKLGGLTDKFSDGSSGPLKEIDPLTFIGYFNRNMTFRNRVDFCRAAKDRMALNSSVPNDLEGIPTLDNRNAWFFAWSKDRGINDIDNLWEFSRRLNDSALDDKLFRKVLHIKRVGLPKLTVLMYLCKPNDYLSFDATNCEYLEKFGFKQIRSQVSNSSQPYKEYQSILQKIKGKFNEKPLFQISCDAWKNRDDKIGFIITPHQFDTLIRQFKSLMPDFEDFSTPGKKLFEREISYKKNALERYQNEIGNAKLKEMIENNKGRFAVQEIAKRIQTNLVKFRSWNSLGDNDEQITAILNKFLDVSQQEYNGEETLKPIFDEARRQNLKPSWDAYSALLWTFNPDDYAPIKISYFRKLAEKLGHELPKGRPSAKKLSSVYEWMRTFWNSLEQAGYEPKNWIEVHSFIWCVCPGTYQEEDHDEKFWLIAPGRQAEFWGEWKNRGVITIGWDKIGDLSKYSSKDEIQIRIQDEYGDRTSHNNSALACYEFAKVMKPGDIVIVKTGSKELLGYGKVVSEYKYDNTRSLHCNLRNVEWIQTGNWVYPFTENETKRFTLKTLTDITKYQGFPEQLITCMKSIDTKPYSIDIALKDLFFTRNEFQEILNTLEFKKNIILQGAPGVGKTFIAKRLAYTLMKEEDPKRVQMIQFHQSYSYEDFIQGYRPDEEHNFKLKNGVFYEFCKKAQRDSENKYVFIIDEINRGNLSKIFGELMMLVEPDKRGKDYSVPLTYADTAEEQFFLPANLYLIGTMNTADRSLAMVDYALRRRFAFITLTPKFETAEFKAFLRNEGLDEVLINKIVEKMCLLNKKISEDQKNLGIGYQIGHSFFCPNTDHPNALYDIDWYRRVINYEIKPLIEEYWFDDINGVNQRVRELLE